MVKGAGVFMTRSDSPQRLQTSAVGAFSLMAAERHEPTCATENLMMMIGAAAVPFCNERLGADVGSRVWGRRGWLSVIRRRDTDSEPERRTQAMRRLKQSTFVAYGQAWTKLTYRI